MSPYRQPGLTKTRAQGGGIHRDEERSAPVYLLPMPATALKQIAIKFCNMKGTVKKEIGEAACFLQAALHTLALRAPTAEEVTEV